MKCKLIFSNRVGFRCVAEWWATLKKLPRTTSTPPEWPTDLEFANTRIEIGDVAGWVLIDGTILMYISEKKDACWPEVPDQAYFILSDFDGTDDAKLKEAFDEMEIESTEDWAKQEDRKFSMEVLEEHLKIVKGSLNKNTQAILQLIKKGQRK